MRLAAAIVIGVVAATVARADPPTTRPAVRRPLTVAEAAAAARAESAARAELAPAYAPAAGQAVRLIDLPFPAARQRWRDVRSTLNGYGVPTTGQNWAWDGPGQLRFVGPGVGRDSFSLDAWVGQDLGIDWWHVGPARGVRWSAGNREVVYRSAASDADKLAALAAVISAETGRPTRVEHTSAPRPFLVVRGPLAGGGIDVGPRHPGDPTWSATPHPHVIVVTPRPLSPADLDHLADAFRVSLGNRPDNLLSFGWAGVGYHLDAPVFDADGGPDGAPRPALADAYVFLDRAALRPAPGPSPLTPDQARQLLANLHAQAGGTWAIERRSIDVYALVSDAAVPATDRSRP